MPSGLNIKELAVGTGAFAESGKVAVAHVRGFLNRGEICYDTRKDGRPVLIALSKRDVIAGLRMGIEGMRVGGRREVIVSPHLAYGAEGVPGSIPPNAVIRFEIDLLDLRNPDDLAAYIPAGKQLMVSSPGKASRNLPKWQFGLHENGSAGITITHPLPDLTWRRAPSKSIELTFNASETEQIFQGAQSAPIEFPALCLPNDACWSDTTEKANAITRSNATNDRCITITLFEKGTVSFNYYLPEKSLITGNVKFYRLIFDTVNPFLSPTAASKNSL